ncbi:RNA 2',3'-cyclic phosphodiesterase [Sphingomonas sp. RP10(2022)]|uniref:RNA 2',3'-cyclic phosphodiesterase n=1 Tax=Sphingomonas liriopis TaxID=2949094 RepID=A0A9X2HTD7_9SPHN|nr:RNA 2',3'-cyclic phosphodiesterase [Sphingomonas liriopis]MCP3735104.1 RNA 2',3'-cyclic phosphodiesterase [Sphingomonas liriopis]
MMRLFVALRPPPAIRAALTAVMGGVPAARWQDDAQLHCTLRFIGEVERPQAEDVAAALASIHAPAPVVRIAGVGRFTRQGRTDTLWAGLAPADALHHLARKVEQTCVRAGLPPERRAYLPHVTLARLPRSAGLAPEIDGWLAVHAGLAGPAFTLPHLMLYQSHLGHGGAAYEPVARWPLEPATCAPGS